MSIYTPDKNGNSETCLLAYDQLESYIDNDIYLNATIGPTSGRIAGATFKINDQTYTLDKNFLGTENLHGGTETFARKIFNYAIFEENNQTQVTFTYRKHGINSKYPGNQEISVIYTVSSLGLLIEYIGKTDMDTLLNMTNHAYFNLSGNLKTNILNHELQVNSSKTIELNDNFVPYKVIDSKGTHLDYRKRKIISDNFCSGIYLRKENGIDNPLLLDDTNFQTRQVLLKDPISKRKLEVYSTYPCVVVYTHNFPDNKQLQFNKKQEKHMGICFEMQNPPNGINIPNLEDSILLKDKIYYHKTMYKFSVEEW